MYRLFKIILYIGVFIGIERFCYRQTCGFHMHKIHDTFHEDPKWDIPVSSPDEEALINTSLNQPFHLIAAGAECYAFESEDGSCVLKVFKMHKSRSIYFRKVYENPLDLLEPGLFYAKAMEQRRQMLEKSFESMLIAYRELKKETGLLTLHLNKNPRFHKTLTLIDGLGNQHVLELDSIRFILQRKALPVYKHLEKLIDENKLQETRESLASLIDLITLRCKKGIADRDPILRTNLGFIGNTAIEIDLGSFSKDPYLTRAAVWKKELYFETYDLRLWLEKKHPQLAQEFHEQLMEALRQS